MAEAISLGDVVTYDGVMRQRAMQRCRVRAVFRCGDLGLRFPDGAVVRCTREGVTKVIAPQHEPMW
ncbi:hypothetical protein [Sphingomonas solaris]|uniref:Uncharacterized protein n=1 Tax=Alterirhizorhabdus solaris TaxID=2529389 RepID=A0A558R860_9SPHN|nr:hypothetical protein [Sphingomonas solaris]TVV75579.1 hypothetical protein FOY91_06880 [Sphingomonas solaris]